MKESDWTPDALAKFAKKLDAEIKDLEAQIFSAVGHQFNIDSPKQLGVVLYEELELEKNPKRTSTGQYSTRETDLERLSGKHRNRRRCVGLSKRAETQRRFTSINLPESVDERTGKLHTHYSQTWTATGRMQSNNPNLQTIPIRKERGRDIRAAFVPRDDDYLILSADYSQIELRVMAELSGDEAMMEAFIQGEDIHTVTASKVYKVEHRRSHT